MTYLFYLGYEIADNDVVAIARLRGSNLQTLMIPQCCVVEVDEDEEGNGWAGHGCVGPEFAETVGINSSLTHSMAQLAQVFRLYTGL